jgi:hypothetical protein
VLRKVFGHRGEVTNECYKGMEWIRLAQVWIQWQALLKTVTNFRVP